MEIHSEPWLSAIAESSTKSLQSVTESDLNGDSMSPMGGTAGGVAGAEGAKYAKTSSSKGRMQGGLSFAAAAH
jgi:hypothetical protein